MPGTRSARRHGFITISGVIRREMGSTPDWTKAPPCRFASGVGGFVAGVVAFSVQHVPGSRRSDNSEAATCGTRHRYEGERHMPQGTVKWFNAEKGFGFIAPDDGSADVFAHYSAITTSGYRTLTDNQRVEFDVVQGQKGLQADNIRPL
jgi:CspA family cold shock protein